MREFDYHEPETLTEALGLLSHHKPEAHLIAGGTALALLLKQGLMRPEHVIGLRRVPELRGIRALADGGIEIGAMATHREAETSSVVRDYCPALATAFGSVATIRIRNQGTIGGNLAHADPSQDPPPMLIALGAEVVLAGPSGERTLPLDAFFVDFLETTIEPEEILTVIKLPARPANVSATYLKFLPNTRDDYATISVAVVLTRGEDGVCDDVRIALAGAGSIPLRASTVEAALRGQALTAAVIEDAVGEIGDDIDPLDDPRGSADYKRAMARVWTKRALTDLASGDATRAGAVPTRQAWLTT